MYIHTITISIIHSIYSYGRYGTIKSNRNPGTVALRLFSKFGLTHTMLGGPSPTVATALETREFPMNK